MTEPLALAAAIVKSTGEYMAAATRGDVKVPAFKEHDADVVSIWEGTRYEAFAQLLGNGVDLNLLADHREQRATLSYFFSKRPHLEFPHRPNGDPLHDTLQAMYRVYLYLEEVGAKVGDKHTDPAALKRAGRSIFWDFENYSHDLLPRWDHFTEALRSGDSIPAEPGTVLEYLYEDITAKTKSIALCARFGPNPEGGFENLIHAVKDQMTKEGATSAELENETKRMRALKERLFSARTPDDLRSMK